MTTMTRRSLLRSSLALTAAGSLARPYIANAAAATGTLWWTQGFVPEEDAAIKKIIADYEKASGNTIELDELYTGLDSGRWLIISGERTDIPNVSGVPATELVMLGGVVLGPHPLGGAERFDCG